jgi:hypothetical protein
MRDNGNRDDRRSTTSRPAWRTRALAFAWDRYRRHILPHLAMALFLVCALEAVKTVQPTWLKATNSAAIRLVLWLDDGLDDVELPTLWLRERLPDSLVAALGVWRPFESELTEKLQAAPMEQAAGSATVVSLTPAAYGHYLNRSSPVPRGPLACILHALSQRLDEMHPAEHTPPVVAIDIDVTPVEGSAPWPPAGSWAGCADAVAKLQARQSQHAETTSPGARERGNQSAVRDAHEAMALVLKELATRNRVVAINYPRNPSSADLRNRFIDEHCCRPPAAADASSAARGAGQCIHFASPHLMYGAQGPVYEYATKLRGREAAARQPTGCDAATDGPGYFPGLGQVMSSAMPADPEHEKRPQSATKYSYCWPSDVATQSRVNDDRLTNECAASIINAYQYSPIALGLARTSVSYFDIDRGTNAAPDDWEELGLRLQNLPTSDMYILTIDSGTTEDKFQVPGSDSPVPGAWLHAAIAITENLDARKSGAGESAHDGSGRFLDIARDLLFGLVFVFVVEVATHGLNRRKNPVIHDLGMVCIPLLLAALFLYLQVLWWVAREFAAHKDQPSMLLLVGMLLDLYLDARAGQWPNLSQCQLSRSARWTQVAGQWAWATAIGVSCVLVASPESPILGWTLAGGAIVGAIYVALAHNLKALPLPWSARSHGGPV